MLKRQDYRIRRTLLQITPDERTALQLLSNGQPAQEVARSLGISAVQIDSILRRLFAAMGAASESEAIVQARRRGLLAQ